MNALLRAITKAIACLAAAVALSDCALPTTTGHIPMAAGNYAAYGVPQIAGRMVVRAGRNQDENTLLDERTHADIRAAYEARRPVLVMEGATDTSAAGATAPVSAAAAHAPDAPIAAVARNVGVLATRQRATEESLRRTQETLGRVATDVRSLAQRSGRRRESTETAEASAPQRMTLPDGQTVTIAP